MTTASVIIVSRDRPAALIRCLTGVSQLQSARFEVVVVADTAGIAAVQAAGWQNRIKLVAFEHANISEARNIGIQHAAGEVIAFIDNDAVPEPTWLARLIAPFDNPQVSAAGGFVRGRNGISYQWRARDIRADATSSKLTVPTEGATLRTGNLGLGTKTEGTNMAFRRSVLASLGGFDPAFRFYLDETDLNLRLAEQGCVTAIVPLAEVHHGFAASDRRRGDRVPKTLFDIGASLAIFLRKHFAGDREARWRKEYAEQRNRLLRHMRDGRIEPRDVGRLLGTLQAGWNDGMARSLAPLVSLAGPVSPFLELRPDPAPGVHQIVSVPRRRARVGHQLAATLVQQGHRVSLYIFSITAVYHRVRFDPAGYWVQDGGLFGKSERSDPIWRYWSRSARLQREVARNAAVRDIDAH